MTRSATRPLFAALVALVAGAAPPEPESRAASAEAAADCEAIYASYVQALVQAQGCHPAAADACSVAVRSFLEVNCTVWVSPENSAPLQALREQYVAAGCQLGEGFPCPAPTVGKCLEDAQGGPRCGGVVP
jgi:hypothetical protein